LLSNARAVPMVPWMSSNSWSYVAASPMETRASASFFERAPMSIQISWISGTFLRSASSMRWMARLPVTPFTGPPAVWMTTRRPEITVRSWPPIVSK